MRRRLAILAGLLVLAPAPAAADPPPIVRPIGSEQGTPQQRGSELFAANCATCHGSRGEGVKPGRGALGATGVAGAGPSLLGVGALAPDFYLTTGYMPLGRPGDQPVRARQRFHADEVRALTTYVASLGRGGPAIPPSAVGEGNVARGLESFSQHCAGCHQVVGQGGVVTGAKAPPLQHATPRQVREAVRIGPYVMPRFSTRAISAAELDDLVAYVHDAQAPKDAGGWGINHIGPFPEGIVTWLMGMVVLVASCVLIGSRLRS